MNTTQSETSRANGSSCVTSSIGHAVVGELGAAIVAGDGDTAERLAAEHVTTFEQEIRKLI